MRKAGLGTALMASAVLAAGCSHTVDGTVEPAPDLARRPLSAETIKQVPLDDAALSKILGQTLVSHDGPESGGPDKLFDSKFTVSPAACLGVTEVLQKTAYEPAEVTGLASETWLVGDDPGKVMLAVEGVVALSTVAQSEALFAKFAKRWQECSGKTALELSGLVISINAIDDVNVTDDIVSATNTVTTKIPNMPPLLPTLQSRAIGVALNCIIEVEVAFFTGVHASDPGSANANTSGADLVRAMQHKIGDLG